MAGSEARPDRSDLTKRLLAVLVRLIRQYAATAQDEATRDVQRLALGLAFVVLSGVLSVHMVVFAHALTVAGLVALGLPVWVVLGGVLGVDLLGVLLALFIGRSLIFQPLLPKTRKSLAKLQEAYAVLAG